MAWSNSKVFRPYIADMVSKTASFDFDADTIRVALYGTTPTPDTNTTSANTAYNVAQWVTANEIYQAGQWAQAGVALATKVYGTGTNNVLTVGAANTASGSAATLSAVYGCQVYDDTLTTPVADQGVSYHYFGGSNSVVNGTFTVIWTSGILHTYTV